jgi:hypothetical protein
MTRLQTLIKLSKDDMKKLKKVFVRQLKYTNTVLSFNKTKTSDTNRVTHTSNAKRTFSLCVLWR